MLSKFIYGTEFSLLNQIREELWELQDKETVALVRESRKGKSKHSVAFKAQAKLY